ncbi:MAG: hypothetical protein AB7G54_09895, partial [Methyloceanibacter sp.]
GLSNEFLRFDAASFIAGALERSDSMDPTIAYASHPPLALRARALFWFDQYRIEHFPKTDASSLAAFSRLDDRVMRDMNKYIESGVAKLSSEASLELRKWIWTATAISKRRFDTKSQTVIKQEFGETFCIKVRDMLGSLPTDAAFDWASDNAATAFSHFRSMFPRRASTEALATLRKSEDALLEKDERSFLRSREWARALLAP